MSLYCSADKGLKMGIDSDIVSGMASMSEALSDPMEDYRCGALADNLLQHYTNHHK